MYATPFAAADWTIIDNLLGKPFASPLKVVNAEIVPFPRLIAIMRAMALASDEFRGSVTIYVSPLQIVVLRIERIDWMMVPRAVRTPLAPPEPVAMG